MTKIGYPPSTQASLPVVRVPLASESSSVMVSPENIGFKVIVVLVVIVSNY